MTEEALEKTLPVAFPTETASASLHARVAAIPPVHPRPKRLWRYVPALAAALWLGHNVPAAYRVWTTPFLHYHMRTWEIQSHSRVLVSEGWQSDGRLRSESHSSRERNITLYRDNELYEYRPFEKAIYHHTLADWEKRPVPERNRFIASLSTLLFRVRGQAPSPTVLIKGKPMAVRPPTEKHYYSEVSLSNGNKLGVEYDYETPIPETIFESTFPTKLPLVERQPPPPPPSALKQWWDKTLLGTP